MFITSVKMITTKNMTVVSLFSGFGVPPAVIVTRWSSWLREILYYTDNVLEIKRIRSLPAKGIIIKNNKIAPISLTFRQLF